MNEMAECFPMKTHVRLRDKNDKILQNVKQSSKSIYHNSGKISAINLSSFYACYTYRAIGVSRAIINCAPNARSVWNRVGMQKKIESEWATTANGRILTLDLSFRLIANRRFPHSSDFL